MQILNDLFEMYHHTGRLAVMDRDNENSTVYVLFEVNEKAKTVRLVELDRPNDGENFLVNLEMDIVYLLDPLEVLERVKEWK